MSKLNWIFTLSSINVLLVTVERFSFTTKILLQPYHFFRLHELFQITSLILFTVLLPVFLLQIVTDNFKVLKTKKGFILFLLFITGIYFYATGNGLHEVSSFNFNNFCKVKNISGDLCGGFFFNDYYTGNIFYFVGGALMIIPLLLLEKLQVNNAISKKELFILLVNVCVYAFAIFAYAAFDRVLVGLVYSIIITIFSDSLFFLIRKNYTKYPVITYTAATYTLGTLLALLVKLHLFQ